MIIYIPSKLYSKIIKFYKQLTTFINNRKEANIMSKRLTITLSDEIYDRIKESAKRDTRTIGEEIMHLLKLHVPTYDELSTK